MTRTALECDHVVIGAGATDMAFADTLLRDWPDVSVLMVDFRHRPGGHLNDACSVARLHQPSEFCGAAWREFTHEVEDTRELNVGMCGPASGDQMLTSLTPVMQWRFLPWPCIETRGCAQCASGVYYARIGSCLPLGVSLWHLRIVTGFSLQSIRPFAMSSTTT